MSAFALALEHFLMLLLPSGLTPFSNYYSISNCRCYSLSRTTAVVVATAAVFVVVTVFVSTLFDFCTVRRSYPYTYDVTARIVAFAAAGALFLAASHPPSFPPLRRKPT